MRRLFSNRIPADLIAVLAGALLLCSHAIYNGYPLLYPDTGTYIASGFQKFIPFDRPVVYGFFIRHISLSTSLWFVAAAQGLLMAWLLLLLFRYFAQRERPYVPYLITLAVLCAFTPIGVNAGQMIPDLFTPVTLIAAGLLLFVPGLTRCARTFIGIILVFATGTHFSHFPLLAGTAIIALFLAWRKRKTQDSAFDLKRSTFVALLVPAAVLLVMLLNLLTGGRWQFRATGEHAFRMNRLISCGIVDEYLDEHCGKDTLSLCLYRDQLRGDFLWSESSPLNRHYGYGEKGWAAAKPEYDRIIADIFSEPRYLGRFIACGLRDAGIQLFRFNAAATPPLGPDSAPGGVIGWHLKKDKAAFLSARQQRGLDYTLFSKIQNVFIVLSAAGLLAFLPAKKWRSRISAQLKAWLGLILAGMLINALVVTTFSMIEHRFQARLIWLLPLALALIISRKAQPPNS
jgi:hypothetical protein